MQQGIEQRCSLCIGFRRCTCEWELRNVLSLGDDVIEGNNFEAEGFRWKLALLFGYRNYTSSRTVRVFLFSCNAEGVRADVGISLLNPEGCGDSLIRLRSKTACPFQSIDKYEIRIDQLCDSTRQLLESGSIVIKADLKNIRDATDEELRKSGGNNTHIIHLEVVDHESISQALSKNKEPRIVSFDHIRHSDVCSGSLVRLWAQQSPDCRYWLCERSANGTLFVKRCLQNARLFERIKNICIEHNTGPPWVTVFKEVRSRDGFQPIDDDTFIVFCLIYDASSEDFTYLGHCFVRKTMTCRDLSTEISEMAMIPEEDHYKVFVSDEGTTCYTDISGKESTLEECGVFSGSTFFLKMVESESGSQRESEIDTDHGSQHGLERTDEGTRRRQNASYIDRMPPNVDVHSQEEEEEEVGDRPKCTSMTAIPVPNKERCFLWLVCLFVVVLLAFASSRQIYFGGKEGGNEQESGL